MSIGLFDLQGGVGEKPDWELTAPLFDEIRIALGSGNKLTIRTRRGGPGDCYIRAARFNGADVNGFAVSAAALSAGGLLEMELDSVPNKKWGVP